MDYEIKDFIGVFKNVFDESYCKNLVDLYETTNTLGFTKNRQACENTSKVNKDNEYVFVNKDWKIGRAHV